MSQRANRPPMQESMPPTDEQHHDTSKGKQSPYTRSEGGSLRRTGISMSSSRASGELEGSTLGGSSRDGDRRTPNQRRTPSSGGFLLDSLPRSNSARIRSHRSRPSEPPPANPITPEPNANPAPLKKRSRLPWVRHKNSASESAATSTVTANTTQHTSVSPPDDQQPQTSSSAEPVQNTQEATNDLDRDSLQIVNLALNLNESRRRNVSGLPLGSTGRRPLSVSQPISAPGDFHGPSPRTNHVSQDQAYHDFTQFPEGDPRGTHLSGQSPVVDFLPAAVRHDHRAYEFSDSTLARAERARRHFDLFHEYLRLLPLLPPLRNGSTTNEEDASSVSSPNLPAHRLHNPLQMVRNRRIRYREKSPINAEAEGWDDPEKVHEWINNIEQNNKHKTFDETQCIKLPSFKHRQVSQGEPDDLDILAASPPSSLRHESRTNSVKAPRLRLDWQTSPAELIADVAWVEVVSNKAKIVDKEGNKIYSDPNEIVSVDANADPAATQKNRMSFDIGLPADDGLSSRHTSLSSSHPVRAHEFKSMGRGRHKHRFNGRTHGSRSRSISSSRKRPPWERMRKRSGSVSSESSADDRRSVDRKHRTLEHSRRDLEKLLHKSLADSSEPRVSQTKASPGGGLNMDHKKPRHSRPLSVNTKMNSAARQASFSSAGSLDDRYNPRASLEGMDSTAPNSPAQVAYFPSIAVNLSPPSSRSPSPAKRGLRHKIAARHERSKSKQGDREFHDHEESSIIPEGSAENILPPPPEQAESTSKLEPSPVPDVVSSSYDEDPGLNEINREDSFRGRKGQNLPESKLRGILKGPGRIAEMVGNEVSKVGDFILKKDLPPDSRKSSSATTLASDSSDSEEDEKKMDKRGHKSLLRRLPTLADEFGRPTRRDSDKGTPSRGAGPTLPSFTSPLRQDERSGSVDAMDLGSPGERTPSSREGPKRMGLSRSKTFDFGPALSSNRGRTKPHEIKDPSIPFSLTRPPVTGLAQASPGSPKEKRPALSRDTRAWSISGRSLQSLNDSGAPSKTEVERTRTLLLSSGVKAREITRRAHTVRDPPPQWLQNSVGSTASMPRVTRLGEFDLAAHNFLRRFEMTQYSFQQSMHHFTTSTSSPLRSQLKDLETLVHQTLTPRVRATADDAEDMCVQLNSTSTLAVKSLSDALDRGVRKRRRRLRWVRRTGFVLLEWALVGMLWWVWLIVMAFKLVRGVFRGAISGARWILWL